MCFNDYEAERVPGTRGTEYRNEFKTFLHFLTKFLAIFDDFSKWNALKAAKMKKNLVQLAFKPFFG